MLFRAGALQARGRAVWVALTLPRCQAPQPHHCSSLSAASFPGFLD